MIEKTNKKGMLKVVIISVTIVAMLLLIGMAYARYITKLNGTSTADIAKWSLKINGSTNQNFVIDLAQTRTGVTQEAEVEGNYIAPGTAGAFQIELDATGSEASLEYDINLNVNYANNTVFPKNLIFYSDSNMQNAIYHDDTSINLNGFIGWNDNSQVQTKTIYWKWDYETGSTQNEINANDELDSYWIGKPILLSMNIIAKQVNENLTTGQYSVTFDANGGTLQGYGNSSQVTKMVTYGDTYGDLPEPTREGYAFKGWNGKNMFNFDGAIYKGATLKSVLNGEKVYKRYSWYRPSVSIWPIFYTSTEYINFVEGEEYSISFDIWADYDINFNNKSIFINNSIQQYTHNLNSIKTYKQKLYVSFIYKDGTNPILHIYPIVKSEDGINTDNNYYIANIQIEQGSTVTNYEPYYITSSTEVVQNKNHTLTAIWEEE